MASKLYFEDIAVGEVYVGDTAEVERQRLLEFAAEFDDQPMHLDADAARAMGLDDVIAPGAYIFALSAKSLRGIWKTWHFLPSGFGIELSFLKPIYPGDTMTAHARVAAMRRSSKPGRGWVDVTIEYLDKADIPTMSSKATWAVRTRDG